MKSNKVEVMETNEDIESRKDNDNVVQNEPEETNEDIESRKDNEPEPDMVKSMCF